MPYVTVAEGLNQAFLDLGSLRERTDAAPWRTALVGMPGLRVVLQRWPPGFATVPHHHPGAEEIFLVIDGQARFTIGDRPERTVGPGELMLAQRGERHSIRVPEDGRDLVLLAAVAPNEDVPNETIEEVTV
jgi:quercetin dioxygenase-like cupin family protein